MPISDAITDLMKAIDEEASAKTLASARAHAKTRAATIKQRLAKSPRTATISWPERVSASDLSSTSTPLRGTTGPRSTWKKK